MARYGNSQDYTTAQRGYVRDNARRGRRVTSQAFRELRRCPELADDMVIPTIISARTAVVNGFDLKS